MMSCLVIGGQKVEDARLKDWVDTGARIQGCQAKARSPSISILEKIAHLCNLEVAKPN